MKCFGVFLVANTVAHVHRQATGRSDEVIDSVRFAVDALLTVAVAVGGYSWLFARCALVRNSLADKAVCRELRTVITLQTQCWSLEIGARK